MLLKLGLIRPGGALSHTLFMLFAAEAYQTEGHVRLHNMVISDEKQVKSEMYEKRDVSRHLALCVK